jgi:hypothetical protein
VNRTGVDSIAEATKQAAEIAAAVPKHLQEAAFNRAFDALTQSSGTPDSSRVARSSARAGRRKAVRTTTKPEPNGGSNDPTSELINSLDRTNHPEIAAATRSLDRALHLLRIAQHDHGIDGLTAPQIAKVLTDKFRHRVSRQAITQALNGAGNFVDIAPQPTGAAIYRLMAPGEQYLKGGGADADGESSTASTGRTKPRRQTQAKQQPGSATDKGSTRKRSGRSPKGLIEELIAEGFFTAPKTIGEIQEQLRHKKGIHLKPTDLSPTLVRLLRQKSLDRERNESNQYEYSAPS